MDIYSWFRERYRRHRVDVWLALVVLVVALLPRMLDLGLFLTADEKNWMERSNEFLKAFLDGRFNDMLQTTHPGVTVLWVVGIAIKLQQWVSGIPYDGSLLIHFVKISQLPVALLNSLWVVGLFGILRVVMERVGRGLSAMWRIGWPLLGTLIIALDPFVIGYSRVVHVDAVLSGLMAVAAAAIVMYAASGWSRRWLYASAVLAALALLTKIPAVFLLPWWGLVVLLMGGSRWTDGAWWRARLADAGRWLGVIVVVILVLWPALVFVPNPTGNALLVKRDVTIAASTPHHMVEDYTLEASHYVFTLITRTTPVTLGLGVLTAVWLAVFTWKHWRSVRSTEADTGRLMILSWLPVAYIFFFVIMMTLGAKKGDRYILPAWPMIDLMAAGGLILVAGWLTRRRLVSKRVSMWVVGGVALVYLSGVVWYYHPYALAYSNPLLASNLSQSLGWGEGLEQAAAWIEEQDPEATIASWYPEELAAFSENRVIHISGHERPKVRYVVLYRNMLGRAEDHPATALVQEYLGQREPVHVVRVAGREYVWIFARPAYELALGELEPGSRVGQTVPVAYSGAEALDVLLANYQGVADTGELAVRLFDSGGGRLLVSWTRPVSELGDNEWLTLSLPKEVTVEVGEDPYVEVSARGVTGERAPTVLYTRRYAEESRKIMVDGQEQEGNLGIRWRYRVGGRLVTDQDVKVLP